MDEFSVPAAACGYANKGIDGKRAKSFLILQKKRIFGLTFSRFCNTIIVYIFVMYEKGF